MRRILALVGGFALLVVLAACGGGGGGGASAGGTTVTMGVASFTAGAQITIAAGQSVAFDDPSDGGGVHNLVTGTGGSFTAEDGAPSEFNSSSGVNFSPGDSRSITFPTAGTYHITCTIHPNMQATITVTS